MSKNVALSYFAVANFLLATASTASAELSTDFTTIVRAKAGPVRGVILQTARKAQSYAAFKGIPYAEPPLGYMRFKPPMEKTKWYDVMDAISEGPACPQFDIQNGTLIGNEDCLHLNVFSPELNFHNLTRNNAKAVMVWIHGGGYSAGYSNTHLYGPDFLLENDVVLVSMNYRLGALGFLNLNHENATGNAGLKDQVLALKWIQNNIADFGGDPARVTIFGTSAGATSVDLHILSDMSTGLFSKSISMSGSILSWIWPLQSETESKIQRLALSRIFRSGSFAKEDILEKMYTAPAAEIVKKSYKLYFRPVIEKTTPSGNEPTFLSSCPIDKFTSGAYNKGPHMLGFTSLEALFFPMYYNTQLRKRAMSPKIDTFSKAFNLIRRGKIKMLDSHFSKQLPRALNKRLLHVTSDLMFNLGVYAKQHLMSKTNGFPLYFYKSVFNFKWDSFHDYLNIEGLGHGQDMAFMFKSKNSPNLTDFRNTDDLFSIDVYTKVLTNFAKFGDPTPEGQKDFSKYWPDSRNNGCYFELSGRPGITCQPRSRTMDFLQKIGIETLSRFNFC